MLLREMPNVRYRLLSPNGIFWGSFPKDNLGKAIRLVLDRYPGIELSVSAVLERSYG